MHSFMRVFQDGFIVLTENWQLLLVILSLLFVSQFVMQRLLNAIFGNRLDEEEYVSLGIAGWLLPACLLSLLWYALQLNTGIFILLPGILVVILFFRSPQIRAGSKTTLAALLGLLTVSVPLRLAFISSLALPMYFDSTRHYTIIQSILKRIDPGAPAAMLPALTTDYYHLGFHFLAAFVASILDTSVAQTMLVLGQIILAAAPFSVFFLIKYETRSNTAALFAILLAGFGWSMPAYALNWGKYPALTSLALLPFVLSIAYLVVQHRNGLTHRKKWFLYALLACAVAICAIVHSRALVVIAIAVAAWTLAGWWQRLSTRMRGVVLAILLLGILSMGLLLYRQEIYEPLFDPYAGQGVYVTILVLCLSIFAQKHYPEWTFAILVAICLVLGALFVPTWDLIARLADRTLLDRPFVEMLLYFPLSLLGGLGAAGLAQTLQPARTVLQLRANYIGILCMTFLIGGAVWHYDFYPSACCSIIGREDMKAMNWIRSNLPEDARILIAADELMISSFESSEGYAPADAGAWIGPLTGRVSVLMLYSTNLEKKQKYESLCNMDVDYIYIGGVGLSFHAPRLRSNPDWYRPVFSRSRVEVYEVMGCR